MKKVLLLYRNAFGGLSKPAWMMSLVMLINRSGSMVTPFLSLYVTDLLGYSLQEAGIILSIYGIGSVCGSFLGGWLTDKIGHFRVQFVALTLGGLLYFVLLNLYQFEYLAMGVFILSLVNDCLRPANAASIAYYAKPENMTRAFSLNRMAINLGFSVGPAVGGLLAAISYRWLFIADGATCIAAGIFFFLYFRKQQGHRPQRKPAAVTNNITPAAPAVRSPYRDAYFLIFAALCSCFAIIFFQLFSTLPLYYRQAYALSESSIGALMALNGLIVFLLEMITVYILGEKAKKSALVATGVLILGVSFVLLNLVQHLSVLYISMLLLSIAEILAMPFMATITVERSGESNRGAYMGLYTISYAIAHVFAPFLGTTLIAAYGFSTLWWATGGLAVMTAVGFAWVVGKIEQERTSKAIIAASEAKGIAVG
ncbi:putative MFS family arabinose efflux permease [Pontibacter ummariensis]|uniref:Predicted arabinose efflux permease, MFS family n=1 Tax=Pontibacter ummariensis TaxID=1610492 RepID=A0A239EEI1_9BACT|nr:MFS transporter [Pontibacter ummariensis]PRY13193.1 putative MFS family arabinose efflux permease [Pontibacter ummariensis]SNS42423.1 Predicted arabinose efflux permease, MFS family [Pontibacter ummariensis]